MAAKRLGGRSILPTLSDRYPLTSVRGRAGGSVVVHRGCTARAEPISGARPTIWVSSLCSEQLLVLTHSDANKASGALLLTAALRGNPPRRMEAPHRGGPARVWRPVQSHGFRGRSPGQVRGEPNRFIVRRWRAAECRHPTHTPRQDGLAHPAKTLQEPILRAPWVRCRGGGFPNPLTQLPLRR